MKGFYHTPTPWMTHGKYIITGNLDGPIDARGEEDAAFIVRAANNLKPLVDALKAALFFVPVGTNAREAGDAVLDKISNMEG